MMMLLLLINPFMYGIMIPCLSSNMSGLTEKMESISTILTLLIGIVFKRLPQRRYVFYASISSSMLVSVLCISNSMNSALIIVRMLQGTLSRILWVFALATLFDPMVNKRNTMSAATLLMMLHHVGSCLGQALGTYLFYYGGKDILPVVCICFSGLACILSKRTSHPSGLFTHVHDEKIPLFKSNGSQLKDTQCTTSLLKDVRMIFCIMGTFITSMVFSTTLLLLSPYLCNINHLSLFDLNSIITTVFSFTNPFICYTSTKSNRVIFICAGMITMSVTLLFISLQTHSTRYLLVLLTFLGFSNGLIQTNLITKIGIMNKGFHDDQAYTLYAIFHVLGSLLALIVSDIMNVSFQNERHSLVLLFSAMILITIPIMMNEQMLR